MSTIAKKPALGLLLVGAVVFAPGVGLAQGELSTSKDAANPIARMLAPTLDEGVAGDSRARQRRALSETRDKGLGNAVPLLVLVIAAVALHASLPRYLRFAEPLNRLALACGQAQTSRSPPRL